ncbi:DUF3850 domain-containing protein [Mycobacterium sp. SA01]|uniref:DUF3850 domain-containing protein n=1 Tax=Mycobacterium sp. SA01 TaxID=3238820 RepID=UPI00351ABA71
MNCRAHELKSWPQFFRAIVAGARSHELRRNDRNYRIGDQLLLREYDPEKKIYSGSSCKVVVTSMTSQDVPCAVSGEGLNPEFCVLSIRVVSVSPDLVSQHPES